MADEGEEVLEGAEISGGALIPEGGYEEAPPPSEPFPEPFVDAVEVESVPLAPLDLVAVSHTPETALDENGVRYMTGRMIHRNAAGDEVPAPTQEPVRTL